MKRIYHGSVDVGIINTEVSNPTYSLVTSPTDAQVTVVKKADDGDRVIASAMYTFYVSPVVLLEKIILKDKVSDYRLEGRSFVDDHKFYERIYPTGGIALNKRLLDNIFVGGKWEFVRGGSVFVGWHWSKVNTINVDKNFVFGQTSMTQAAFDLSTDSKYKKGVAFGLNLDIRIITNLFQTSQTGQTGQ
jgi:hypothetical protein